ncbi:tripartite tricarboxylate transporter TctB family protein [uncultured Alsobacter sp.]|uniref:tripartite tricarboxylate transporter TctB family protein n=1 Tax=uncultured Alsobacter sp. TaxID=1748258 RepID=UPI0025ED17A0|nr:tripartite tricarboxylate transporter TctB family protein [uncultured Alsobacter sp.]
MNRDDVANDDAGRSAPRFADWVLPAFAGICGALLVLEGTRLPLFEQYTGLGPGFMPMAVGLGLLGVAASLVWQVLQGERFMPEEAEGADASAPVSLPRLGLAAAGVFSPVVTFPQLGFPLGATLAFTLVARAFGSKKPLLDLVFGGLLSAAAWFAFTKLGVQLGPFLSFGAR